MRAALHSRNQRSVKAATVFDVVQNATSAILEELQIVRSQQALAASLSAFQLVLFLTYLVVQVVLCAVKKCKEHQARQLQENLENLEMRLANRKASRRKSAAKTAQETQ